MLVINTLGEVIISEKDGKSSVLGCVSIQEALEEFAPRLLKKEYHLPQ